MTKSRQKKPPKTAETAPTPNEENLDEEELKVIKAKADTLQGLKVLGKIDLPSEKIQKEGPTSGLLG